MIDNAYELRRHIHEFVNVFGLASERRTPCGKPMTVARAHSLLLLYQADDGLQVDDLAVRLHVDVSDAARLSEKLERDGLVERRECPDNPRANRLHLSEDGRALAAEVDAASLSRFASILEKMPEKCLGQVLESIQILNQAIADYENS
jgi:DNA-binding MarR family transcriptional regulator